MPAISPARLKKDAAEVFDLVADAAAFDRGLEDLFERYADRTYRKSQAGLPGSLLPAYHVPRPVLRQLEIGLEEVAAQDPAAALGIAGRLWGWVSFEPKFLAIRILGSLPGDYDAQVMAQLQTWLGATEDDDLQNELVRVGLAVDEARLAGMVEAFLEDGGPGYRKALSALGALAWNASSEALPGVFRLLGKALENPAADKSTRLVYAARGLANRSPVEAAYFLRHQYLLSLRPEVGRIIRQLMPLFPDALQKEMRRMMRENT